MRAHVRKETRCGAQMMLRDTPLLRDIAKHLIAAANQFLAGVPQRLQLKKKRGVRFEKRAKQPSVATAIDMLQ